MCGWLTILYIKAMKVYSFLSVGALTDVLTDALSVTVIDAEN